MEFLIEFFCYVFVDQLWERLVMKQSWRTILAGLAVLIAVALTVVALVWLVRR